MIKAGEDDVFGPFQPNIYGETFDVQSALPDEEAINIAYTTEALQPHMDLMYYDQHVVSCCCW